MSLQKITQAILLFLLVMPLAFAFNCYHFSGIEKENCLEISSSNLNEGDKNKMYAGLIFGSNTYADFKAIRSWNLAQDTVKSDSAKTASGKFVKNVWLDQFAIMPSVIDSNNLFVPEQIEVLTGFSYDISVPNNYYSGKFPRTSEGDCRREYSVKGSNAKMEVFVNGELQGSGTLVASKIKEDSIVESKLSVDVNVEIDHYDWDSWCCRRGEDGCVKHCHKCKFNSDEIKTDRIRLSDSTNVKFHNLTPYIELEINEEYYGTTKGKVMAHNYSEFELQFEDSKLKRTAYLYEAIFDGSLNYIATIKASPHKGQTIKNIYLENNTFYVKNREDCKVISKTHFKAFEDECNFIINHTKELEEFELQKFGADVYFAFGLSIFLFVNYMIYKVILHYWERFQ